MKVKINVFLMRILGVCVNENTFYFTRLLEKDYRKDIKMQRRKQKIIGFYILNHNY